MSKNLSRRQFLKTVSAAALFAPYFMRPASANENRPNILFILTDDQPYGIMGCEGNPIVQTPNIDKLAGEGVHFRNAHITSAICTPSRVSIFLSQYERKHGVNFNSGTAVSEKAWATSYPMVLRRYGYYTGYVGKNHTPVGEGGYESGVLEKSFDYWYAGHGHLKFYPKRVHKNFKGAQADTQAEILEEGALDFLDDNGHALEGALHFLDQRPKDKPFCLSICFNLPHGAGISTMEQLPTDPEIYRTLYRDLDIPLPRHYVAKNDIKNPKLPESIHHYKDRQTGYDWVDNPATVRERLIRTYQAMTGIDRLVGHVRQRLEQLGLANNTVIFFTSDHGLFYGQFGLGGKALCYEVTTHVPMIIYDPRASQSARRKENDQLVQSIDMPPTMLELAGAPIPKSYQGKSLAGFITGDDEPVREYLFTENLWSTHFGNPRCEAVQDREWKYIRYYANHNESARQKIEAARQLGVPINQMLYNVHDPDMAVYRRYIEAPLQGEQPVYEELYNLQHDPDETTNLIDQPEHTPQLERLRKAWHEMISEARGAEPPQVVRYTADSMADSKSVKHE